MFVMYRKMFHDRGEIFIWQAYYFDSLEKEEPLGTAKASTGDAVAQLV